MISCGKTSNVMEWFQCVHGIWTSLEATHLPGWLLLPLIGLAVTMMVPVGKERGRVEGTCWDGWCPGCCNESLGKQRIAGLRPSLWYCACRHCVQELSQIPNTETWWKGFKTGGIAGLPGFGNGVTWQWRGRKTYNYTRLDQFGCFWNVWHLVATLALQRW